MKKQTIYKVSILVFIVLVALIVFKYRREEMKKELRALKIHLGSGGAIERAAEAVVSTNWRRDRPEWALPAEFFLLLGDSESRTDERFKARGTWFISSFSTRRFGM